MRVQVTYRCHGAANRYRLREFTAQTTACCEQMTAEWGATVDVYLCGFPAARNIKPVLFITATDAEDAAVATATVQISHCPWCGEKIEVDTGLDATPEEGGSEAALEINF